MWNAKSDVKFKPAKKAVEDLPSKIWKKEAG